MLYDTINIDRLDSTNIFEFLIKWQRGKGLDPLEKTTHAEYLQELSLEMIDALKARISATAEAIESQSRDEICQEVMCHSVYCKKKATTFMVVIIDISNCFCFYLLIT